MMGPMSFTLVKSTEQLEVEFRSTKIYTTTSTKALHSVVNPLCRTNCISKGKRCQSEQAIGARLEHTTMPTGTWTVASLKAKDDKAKLRIHFARPTVVDNKEIVVVDKDIGETRNCAAHPTKRRHRRRCTDCAAPTSSSFESIE